MYLIAVMIGVASLSSALQDDAHLHIQLIAIKRSNKERAFQDLTFQVFSYKIQGNWNHNERVSKEKGNFGG